MNRHERRRQIATRKRNIRTVSDAVAYLKQLPEVPIDEPMDPDRVYHHAYLHDDWCQYRQGRCNCDVVTKRFVEPVRS